MRPMSAKNYSFVSDDRFNQAILHLSEQVQSQSNQIQKLTTTMVILLHGQHA